jgi:hypothetical protein
LHCILAVSSCCGKDLRIITKGGGLAIYTSVVRLFLSYASLVWWKRVNLKNAQQRLFHLHRMTCLGNTGGMRSTATSALDVMLMLPPLHLFIKQEARQAAYRLLGNVPNFGHSEVLIRMTDETPLLLAPRDKFVTLNIFDTREDWTTECVDLVTPDGLLCWPLNRMSCPPELYYGAEILFRKWQCLTEFDWCELLDTVVSMKMRRPTHLQGRDQVLLLWGRSLVFRWHLRVSSGGSGSGYLNHTAPHGAWRLLVVSRECG